MNEIHARGPVLLFMKAVTKKQVWIPGFTKRNGTVVQGHYTTVNVSTDHDEHKAVAGQGNYTEQQAHKKLSKKGWFNDLAHEHKVAHVLKEATSIQAQASMLSRANSLKKKILAGEKPTPGEWKAFSSLPAAKQEEFGAAFKEAGKWHEFAEGFHNWQPETPQEAPQSATEPSPKTEPAKEEPKPAAAEPEAAEIAPKNEPISSAPKEDGSDAVLAKIAAAKAKLPEGHHITPGQKKKLDAIKQALQAGDAKSILMHGYQTHTYGKQAAKLANEALAAIGSKHTVTPGQKMGEHAALKGDDAPSAERKPEPDAEPQKVVSASEDVKAPEPERVAAIAQLYGLAMPEFAEGKEKGGVKAYYEKVGAKIIAQAIAGNVAVLQDMPTDKGNTWKGKTANSKALLKLYDDALKMAKGKSADAVDAAPMPVAPASKYPVNVFAPLADEAHAAFDKGEFEKLGDLFNEASNADMKATADYIYDLSESRKTGEPRDAVSSAAEAAPEKRYPAGVDVSLAQDVDKALKEGDLKTLWDIHKYAFTNGMKPTLKYAFEKIAELTAKNDEPQFADGDNAAPVAPSGAAGVQAALEGHPEGVSPATYGDVKAMAEKGDKAALLKYAAGKAAHIQDWVANVVEAVGGPVAMQGPQEGDTKQGADGMLVLRGGRWVKMGGDAPAKSSIPPEILANSVPKPKFEGTNKLKMTKTVKELHAIAIQHGVDGLKGVVSINASGTTKISGGGITGYWGGLQSPNGKLLAAYAHALIAKMEGSSGTGVAPTAPAPKKKAAPKVTGSDATVTESVDGWKQVGPQGGYNPGGTYEDGAGQKWYVKFPAGGEKVAKNELVATKLYALAGVEVPEVKLINQGGKIGLASKIVDGAVANKSALLEGKAKGLLSGFGADAWLANWDTVGNNPAAGKGFDNILIKTDGSAVRIDAGGALLYGGAGGKKQTFENEVTDLKTMLDPAKNANTAAVFGKMSAADIAASVAKIASIPDHEIEGVVMEFGPGSASEKTRLAEKLIARKHNMSEQYPSAKKKASGPAAKKAKPDPTALPVDASLLPSPHDFMNWQGTGKPISEKPYVKGNIADEQEILNLALTGNLIALKDYKFQPVDKLTGEAVGSKQSIEKHPSKYVQDFHNTIVSYLDMLANPPEELRHYQAKSASTLASLSAAFKPHDFGMTTEKASKNQQIGFWIALGVAEAPGKFAKAAKALSANAIAAANAAHAKLPASVKKFISGVQGSGSYNNPYRDGKDTDHSGAKTRDVLGDLYANATTQAAGTQIHKWMSLPPDTVKQFMDAPEGLVFQNPGSMCTSYHPTATNGFGKDRVTIRYAEGAKALNSFASGQFSGEKEVTTLPGARFMVLSRKMVADVEHGKPNDKRFELELLMLPPDPTYVDNLSKGA